MTDPTNPAFAPMPSEAGLSPQGRNASPRTVSVVVRLMFARGAVTVLGVIAVLATQDTLRRDIAHRQPHASDARVNQLLHAAIGVDVAVGIIAAGAYLLLATQVQRGKHWARVVTWILAGLGVLAALAALAQPGAALTRVVLLIGGILDIAVIVLLTRRSSGAHFQR
jgi:hypothetical protein